MKKLSVKNQNNSTNLTSIEKYLISLNHLAKDCDENNDLNLGITYMNEIQDICRSLSHQDKIALEPSYIYSLDCLYDFYLKKDLFEEAIKYLEEIKNFYKNLYLQDNALWAHKYVRSLSSMASAYKRKGFVDKSIVPLKEEKEVLQLLYKDDKKQ